MPEDPKSRRLRDRLQRRVRGAVERAGVRALEAARPTVRRALEVILEEPLPARPAEPVAPPESSPAPEVPPRVQVPLERELREPLGEIEGRTRAAPLDGAPPLPPDMPPGGPVGPSGDAATPLMEQLSHLTIATNEIYNRLVAMGHQDAADAIVRVPKMPTVTPEPIEPVPPVEAPEEPPQEIPEVPEARYLLQGSNLFVPYMDPENAWFHLKQMWEEASIGSPRDPVSGEPLDDTPPYAPDAYAKGSTLDPGIQVPRHAISSAESFTEWANENGFGSGVAIEVDGLIAGPGRSVMPSGRSRRVKVPSTITPGDS
jgi:hypothetical protein